MSISILYGYPYLIGLHIMGFIWGIPILIFAYVLFWGPKLAANNPSNQTEADLAKSFLAQEQNQRAERDGGGVYGLGFSLWGLGCRV